MPDEFVHLEARGGAGQRGRKKKAKNTNSMKWEAITRNTYDSTVLQFHFGSLRVQRLFIWNAKRSRRSRRPPSTRLRPRCGTSEARNSRRAHDERYFGGEILFRSRSRSLRSPSAPLDRRASPAVLSFEGTTWLENELLILESLERTTVDASWWGYRATTSNTSKRSKKSLLPRLTFSSHVSVD